jgi:hypothetical protein
MVAGYGIPPQEMLAWISSGVASTNLTSQLHSPPQSGRPTGRAAPSHPATRSPSCRPFGMQGADLRTLVIVPSDALVVVAGVGG